MVSTQPHGLNVCNLRFVFVNALIAPICCLSLSFSFSICLSGSWIKKDEDYFFYSWRVCVACLALITVFYTDISCFDSSRNSGECLHIPMYLNRQERETGCRNWHKHIWTQQKINYWYQNCALSLHWEALGSKVYILYFKPRLAKTGQYT